MITIVKGRGNNRKVVMVVPHASVIKRSSEQQQAQFSGLVCDIMGVK